MSRVGYIQSDLDLKLLILYIMNRVATPITFNQLLELALCDGGVDYFSLTQAVSHLVETEHLTLENERYSITEKGSRNSEICQSTLPFSVRRRCDDNLAALNTQLRREAQVRGTLSEREDGTFTVTLALDDDAGSLLRLELLIPTREQAEALIEQFRTDPQQVYSHLLDALIQNEE